ncbi:MAG TPA: tetratricopeptide repeat protein [Methylocella sp.]|nr:tetratricopeptide repeat protein [Methylocella sp.]
MQFLNGRHGVLGGQRRVDRRLAMQAAVLAAVLCLAGCQSGGPQDITGAIGGLSEPDGRRAAEEWGRLYDRYPDDKQVALNYARALRGMSEQAQAVAILQRLSIKFPRDLDVLGAYGKALAHAHTPERPNWSVLSAHGSVADQLGDHEQAQAYYAAALKIAPAQPHVLSNLGLSYALSKKLPEAETTLRQAAAEPGADRPVRQNLALVLALEGKFSSAEEVARRDLDPKDASANVAAIRRMIAQSNTWKQIQALDSKPGPGTKTHVGSVLE